MKKISLIAALLTVGFSLQITPAAMNDKQYTPNDPFDRENYPQISNFSMGWDKIELIDLLATYLPMLSKELAEERVQGENPAEERSLASRIGYTRNLIAEIQKLANDPEAMVNNKKLSKDEKMKLYSAIAQARNALR